MELRNRCRFSPSSSSSSVLVLLLFPLLAGLSASTSTFISDGVIFSDRASSIGRNLLQAKKACPVSFEFMNYTIITSQCKGPNYPPNLCCGALKEFACPYAEYVNDLSNECATTMFSYINLYGKYPPGLFASECREGKLGLLCPATAPSESANSNGVHIALVNPSPVLLLFTAGLLVLLLLD